MHRVVFHTFVLYREAEAFILKGAIQRKCSFLLQDCVSPFRLDVRIIEKSGTQVNTFFKKN
jgi:hypothetical protein